MISIDYFKLTKSIVENLLDRAIQLGIQVDSNFTIKELIDIICDEYGDTPGSLIDELAEDFYFVCPEQDRIYILYELYDSLRNYCLEVEKDYGISIIRDTRYIYIALYKYLLDSYLYYKIKDFGINDTRG